jgi:anti-sigma B factor antagonist
MTIDVRQVQDVTVVALSGELTWKSAPEAQQGVLAQARPDGKLVIDMTGVTFLASAGLRMLLQVYRAVSAAGGKVVLLGLSEDIKSTMEVTGFLEFFRHHDNIEACLAEFAS